MSLFDQPGDVWMQSTRLQAIAAPAEPSVPSIVHKASAVNAWHPAVLKTLVGGAVSMAPAQAAELKKALKWGQTVKISSAVEPKASHIENASFSG